MPHKENPRPLDNKDFSGAYVTKKSGTCSGGTIESIQLEFNGDSRREPDKRLETAENLVTTINQFFGIHYSFEK